MLKISNKHLACLLSFTLLTTNGCTMKDTTIITSKNSCSTKKYIESVDDQQKISDEIKVDIVEI